MKLNNITAVLQAILGVLLIIAGIFLFIPSSEMKIFSENTSRIISSLVIIFCALWLTAAWGTWKNEKWGKYLALGLALLVIGGIVFGLILQSVFY